MARILLDTCVPLALKGALASQGHDVVHCLDWENDPGDEAVLAQAVSEGRILFTSDKGFTSHVGEAVAGHCGIIRMDELPFQLVTRIVPGLIAKYGRLLSKSGVIIVERGGVRVLDFRKNRENGDWLEEDE